jgi:MoaA/NifB/PqqE/SkfB family radical SAM enzyme
MTVGDWTGALDQLMSLGLQRVQLIGGEPTRYPGFIEVLDHAVDLGLTVSVFSNLRNIRSEWWPKLARPGVGICVSYYSDEPDEHDRVTTRRGSHARTRTNILRALAMGMQVKAAITTVFEGQRVYEAKAELEALGVDDVRVDGVRQVGRGGGLCDVAELCGNCGRARLAILPDGIVTPCVLGRWLKVGNVRVTPIAEILTAPTWAKTLERIPRPIRPACLPHAGRMQRERERTHAHL